MTIFLILIALVIGINFKYSIILCSILSILLIVFFAVRFSKKKKVIIPIVFILIGVGISFINIDIIQETYTGVVIESNENYIILLSKFERLYLYSKNNQYEIGDILSVSGPKSALSFTTIESGFDFRTYLEKKGVNYQLNNYNVGVIFSNPIKIKAFRNSFLSHFNEETKTLINAILFGKSGEGDLVKNISLLHLNKFVSSSGLYLHAFNTFLVFLFSMFMKRKYAKAITYSFLIVYGVFTFPRFSVIRYLFVLFFRELNNRKGDKKLDFISVIGLSGLLFITIDYHLAYTDGFILGFSIPVVIYFLRSCSKRFKKMYRKPFIFISTILFFIPFEIKFYNEINLLGYPLQVVLSPLFIVFGIISFICFFKIPIYGASEFVAYLIKNVTGNLAKISLCIFFPEFNDIFIVLFYFLYFACVYYIDVMFIPMIKIYLVSLISFVTLYSLPVNNLITTSVSFINVGQGDSCLVRKGNTAILIDTGGNIYTDIATECLIPYLKKQRIYNIDLLITTHDDFDHSGAKDSLINNFKVKNYISDIDSFPITINDIKIYNYNSYFTAQSDENDKSLVLGFELSNTKYLIMGDAPTYIEKEILQNNPDLKCDILKVGHHGSDTSSCYEFISSIQPSEAIISVGKNNYGHPKESVLNTLKSCSVKIRRTDKEGTITYKSYLWC